MLEIQRSALVEYSAQQMFDLVNDVNDYPNFLPGCVLSEVREQSDLFMNARLVLKKGLIEQSFSTKNTLVRGKSIKLELLDGPFKSLQGKWIFHELTDDACKVQFELEFEFSNPLTTVAFGKMFNKLTSRLVDSFVTRAKDIYG